MQEFPVQTRLGAVRLQWRTPGVLTQIGLPSAPAAGAADATAPDWLTPLVTALRAWDAGDMTARLPDDLLDLSGRTPFQQRVYAAARQIPAGATRSYGWLAAAAGSPCAARAVGQAMASNDYPLVIPCHRVICADGTLGGFGGGRALKRAMLDWERTAARHAGR